MGAIVAVLSMSNIKLWIELRSIQKSTHQIMMPSSMADTMFEKPDEKTKEAMAKQFEDYAGIN